MLNRFTLIAVVGLTIVVGKAAPTVAAESGAVPFPTFGISITPPSGWVRGPEQPVQDLIAQWGQPEGAPGAPVVVGQSLKAVLVVNFFVVGKVQLHEFAEARAKRLGASIDPNQSTLDGVPALRLTVPAPTAALQAVEILYAQHEGFFYVVTVAGKKTEPLASLLQSVRESFRWIPLESPARHLEFRPAALAIMDGSLEMNYPQIMRPLPVPDPVHEAHVGTLNLIRRTLDFAVHVRTYPLTGDMTARQFEDQWLNQLPRKVQLEQPIAGAPDPKNAACVVTPLVKAAPAIPGQPAQKSWSQWAMIDLGDRSVVLVSVAMALEIDPADRDAYASAATRIIDSLHKVIKAKPAGPATRN